MKALFHPAIPQDTWRFGVVCNEPTTITLVAMGVQAASSLAQGIQQSNVAKANAAVANRNAEIARQQAKADAEAKQREVTRAMGAARAAYGASGVTAEGSPLDVLSASAALGELDVQNVLYKGRLREIGYQDTAAIETNKASSYLTQGIFGAGSSLLKGAGKLDEQGFFG